MKWGKTNGVFSCDHKLLTRHQLRRQKIAKLRVKQRVLGIKLRVKLRVLDIKLRVLIGK